MRPSCALRICAGARAPATSSPDHIYAQRRRDELIKAKATIKLRNYTCFRLVILILNVVYESTSTVCVHPGIKRRFTMPPKGASAKTVQKAKTKIVEVKSRMTHLWFLCSLCSLMYPFLHSSSWHQEYLSFCFLGFPSCVSCFPSTDKKKKKSSQRIIVIFD